MRPIGVRLLAYLSPPTLPIDDLPTSVHAATFFMHHIIYVSQATAPFGDAQLRALLTRARATNAQHGITGILLYGNDQFMQVLEGEKAAVRARYNRIQQDPRHQNISIFVDNAIEARSFPDWHMNFSALPAQPFLELTNYVSWNNLRLEAISSTQADTYIEHLMYLIKSLI